MTKKKSESGINVNIDGQISGQVVIGNNNKAVNKVIRNSITPQEMAEIRNLLAELRNQVQAQAPEEAKSAALEKVKELEEAVLEEKPDLTTMEYVKKWFGKNLPGIAGTVTGLFVHPLVGKLVESAGEMVADEFKKRFS